MSESHTARLLPATLICKDARTRLRFRQIGLVNGEHRKRTIGGGHDRSAIAERESRARQQIDHRPRRVHLMLRRGGRDRGGRVTHRFISLRRVECADVDAGPGVDA